MLGTVLDKITSLVGRAFVIGAFFPILFFTASSLPALAAVEGIDSLLKRWEALKDLKTLASVGFFLAVVASAYLLMIVNPVLKRVLEGAYPLGFVGGILLTRKRKRFVRMRSAAQESLTNLVRYRSKREEWANLLQQANQKRFKRRVRPPQQVEELEKAEGTLKHFQETGKLPELKDLEEAAANVKKLYGLNYPMDRLERLHRGIIQLWEDVEKMAEASFSDALSDIQSRYAYSAGIAGVHPTSLGNIIASAWFYPYTRYGIDATLMWPRLQKLIPADYLRVVEDARISYDFSVAMTFLSLLYSCVWLIIFLVRNAIWPWAWIPAIGILACVIFHEASIEAARAFGAVFRSCFDLFRFPLMQELRIQFPVDIKAERETWNRINQILIFEDWTQDLKYVHPTQTGAPAPVAPVAPK